MFKKNKEIITVIIAMIISLLVVFQLSNYRKNYSTLEIAVKKELYGSEIVGKYEVDNGCFVIAKNKQKKHYGYFIKNNNRWYHEKNVTITSHFIDNSFYVVDYYYRNENIDFVYVNNSEISTIKDSYNNKWEKLKNDGFITFVNNKIDDKYYLIIDGINYNLQ